MLFLVLVGGCRPVLLSSYIFVVFLFEAMMMISDVWN
jgi:hypothetical protein